MSFLGCVMTLPSTGVYIGLYFGLFPTLALCSVVTHAFFSSGDLVTSFFIVFLPLFRFFCFSLLWLLRCSFFVRSTRYVRLYGYSVFCRVVLCACTSCFKDMFIVYRGLRRHATRASNSSSIFCNRSISRLFPCFVG